MFHFSSFRNLRGSRQFKNEPLPAAARFTPRGNITQLNKNVNIVMMSLLSNSCVGAFVYKRLNLRYNNPLIGSLFLKDADWISFSKRPQYYLSLQPHICHPTDKFIHEVISPSYPVVILDDIRIDFIHEKPDKLYEKYMRRADRFANTEPYLVWSFSEMMSDHENHQNIIDAFLSTNTTNTKAIFLGPPRLKSEKEFYITIEKWENCDSHRDTYGVPVFNDQLFVIDVVTEWFHNHLFLL